jgi:hypothetical protein
MCSFSFNSPAIILIYRHIRYSFLIKNNKIIKFNHMYLILFLHHVELGLVKALFFHMLFLLWFRTVDRAVFAWFGLFIGGSASF